MQVTQTPHRAAAGLTPRAFVTSALGASLPFSVNKCPVSETEKLRLGGRGSSPLSGDCGIASAPLIHSSPSRILFAGPVRCKGKQWGLPRRGRLAGPGGAEPGPPWLPPAEKGVKEHLQLRGHPVPPLSTAVHGPAETSGTCLLRDRQVCSLGCSVQQVAVRTHYTMQAGAVNPGVCWGLHRKCVLARALRVIGQDAR